MLASALCTSHQGQAAEGLGTTGSSQRDVSQACQLTVCMPSDTRITLRAGPYNQELSNILVNWAGWHCRMRCERGCFRTLHRPVAARLRATGRSWQNVSTACDLTVHMSAVPSTLVAIHGEAGVVGCPTSAALHLQPAAWADGGTSGWG